MLLGMCTSRLVVPGGVAKLIVGAISSLLKLSAIITPARVIRSCAGEGEREVEEVLGPVGVDEGTCRAVAKALRWSTAFLLKFGQGLEEVPISRLYISVFTIGLGYLIGGLVPLFPYFFIPEASTVLIYSCVVMGVVLLVFGAIKAQRIGCCSDADPSARMSCSNMPIRIGGWHPSDDPIIRGWNGSGHLANIFPTYSQLRAKGSRCSTCRKDLSVDFTHPTIIYGWADGIRRMGASPEAHPPSESEASSADRRRIIRSVRSPTLACTSNSTLGVWKGIVWGAVSTLLVGGLAAGAALGIVKALEGDGE
ncbi:hypothetical protein D9758_015981 [Tetrapyrgos nigripes]|uniref:Uncharacterized protein n=1 Tax=Tetrapyrgos nigripes TaxID=182062 RepID=A0A8H5BX03_9AGAR|nr:hypothetical protein D9758_015981 [Tetrapyrgos nigripes]